MPGPMIILALGACAQIQAMLTPTASMLARTPLAVLPVLNYKYLTGTAQEPFSSRVEGLFEAQVLAGQPM